MERRPVSEARAETLAATSRTFAGRAGRAVSLVALVALVALAASCAEKVGLIDRTQPGLLAKSLFEGEWFLRRTVVDVPYDVGYTFIGEQEDVQRIRWDLQRDLLVAYRVHPLVEGTPDSAPVAAFKIEKHVDVVREYNEATGEETNVLGENDEDRMWYERSYVRVDWSQNLLSDFHFIVGSLDTEPVAYHVEDVDDPDAVLVGVKDKSGAWQDFQHPKAQQALSDAQYLDVVTKVFVRPEEIWVEDDWGETWTEPACWYYLNYDCAPGVITVRNAFLRVDAALSDYEPLVYPDNQLVLDDGGHPIRFRWNATGDRERVAGDGSGDGADGPDDRGDTPSAPGPADPYASGDQAVVRLPFFDKFGYFRVERYGYDPLYGEVEDKRIFLANRWNLWEKSHDADGNALPYADRGFRPIVFYLSPDYPEALEPVAFKAIDRWNEAFRDTAQQLSGQTPPRMFELRRNSRQVDPETGRVLKRGEVNGDLRYSHLFLVTAPTRAGLLGYGPSAADPYTGELFAADAYIYGGPSLELAARGRDTVDLINGRLDPEEFALGRHVTAYLAGLRGGSGASAPPSAEAVRRFAKEHPGPAAARPGAARKSARPPKTSAAEVIRRHPVLERLLRPAGWADARLEHARGTAIEDLLMNDDAIRLLKGTGRVDAGVPTSALSAGLREKMSPVHWASPKHRRATLARMRGYAKRNLLMASFMDDAVAGLALELKDKPPDEVVDLIYATLIRSTAEHEVGHTLGLRHNFEASSDALNYHPEYWALRGSEPLPMAEMSVGEREGKLREYQYSSIMDYAGRFNTDASGLGYYDHAAIKFAYGGLVEVFETAPTEPLLAVTDYGDGAFDRPFTLDDVLRRYRHYTKIPGMFGGTAGIAARKDVPYTADDARKMGRPTEEAYADQLTGDAPWRYVEVPYRFCSDEYEFGTGTCLAYDLGADRYEVVRDAVDRYWNYYWFNNFKRDRVFFDEWDYMDAMWWRYFAFIQNAYQNWVFDRWFVADVWDWLRQDPETWGIEDADWIDAVDAGHTATAAVMEGVRFLQQVLAQPEPGGYMYDEFEGYYWALSEDPLPVCEGEPSYYNEAFCSDVNVPLGDGRWFYSIYDWESGYYFYERLKWIGTFYDKLLALEAFTSPDTYFLGVDTFQSVDEWAISMYLYFPKEIHKVFAGIAADRFDLFAGVVTADNRFLAPDPFAIGAAADIRAAGRVIDPYTSFTMQLYTLWYGMAWLNANFDNHFNDSAKIWLKGSGEAIEPPTGGEATVVEFASPFNGRTYVSLKQADEKLVGVGAMMLEQANRFRTEWAEYAADPTTDPGTLDYMAWRIENIVENIEVVRGLYDLYGYLYF